MIFSFWSFDPFDPKSSHLKQLLTPNCQFCNEHCSTFILWTTVAYGREMFNYILVALKAHFCRNLVTHKKVFHSVFTSGLVDNENVAKETKNKSHSRGLFSPGSLLAEWRDLLWGYSQIMGGSFHQIIASTREEHLSIALYAQHTYWTNTALPCPKVSQAVWVLIDRKADMRLLFVAHLLLPGTLQAVGRTVKQLNLNVVSMFVLLSSN